MDDTAGAIRREAAAIGFDAVGIARADVALEDDFRRYEAFVDAGMHARMAYLARNREARRQLFGPSILAGARSVVCLAQRYAVQGPEPHGLAARIATYARGLDYHDHVRRRLRRLAAFVRELFPGARARALCDTAPVLERAWAARAGLGFVGKNGMLICRGVGSFVVLGEIVTDAVIAPDPPPKPMHCGRCTLCMEACPVGAIAPAYVVDPRRCVAYLTIEHPGPYDLDLVPLVAPRLFGCDACQQVCPHNAAPSARIPSGSPFDALERWQRVGPDTLLTMTDTELRELGVGTPLGRLSPMDWRRNALAALCGEPVDAALREAVLGRGRATCEPAWLRQIAEFVLA